MEQKKMVTVTIAIAAAITVLLISSEYVNAFAQTIEFDIKKQSNLC
jgi:hypothetical protein